MPEVARILRHRGVAWFGLSIQAVAGHAIAPVKADGVAFFEAGAVALSLYGKDALASDSGLDAGKTAGFRATSLAWNCADEAGVDAVLALAVACGATLLKSGHRIFWGGYVGFFEDPDGHVWEVAHNPQFPLSADGRITLPD